MVLTGMHFKKNKIKVREGTLLRKIEQKTINKFLITVQVVTDDSLTLHGNVLTLVS